MGSRRKRQVQIQVDVQTAKAIRSLRRLGATDDQIMRGMKKNVDKAASSWDRLRKSMRKNWSTIQAVQGAMDIAGRVMSGVQRAISGVTTALRAAAEERTGIRQMNAALDAMGESAAGASAAVEEFATRQQELTRFGDTITREITTAFATAASGAGLSARQIVSSVRLIQDISERTGRSASELSVQLAGLYGGNFEIINSLLPAQRQHIEMLRLTHGESTALAGAIDALGDAYGGAAEDIDEYDQFLAEASNNFSDFVEWSGEAFLSAGFGLSQWFRPEFYEGIGRLIDGTAGSYNYLTQAITEAIEAAEELPEDAPLLDLWSPETLRAMELTASQLEVNSADFILLAHKIKQATSEMEAFKDMTAAAEAEADRLSTVLQTATQAILAGASAANIERLSALAESEDPEVARSGLMQLLLARNLAAGERRAAELRARSRRRRTSGGGGREETQEEWEVSGYWDQLLGTYRQGLQRLERGIISARRASEVADVSVLAGALSFGFDEEAWTFVGGVITTLQYALDQGFMGILEGLPQMGETAFGQFLQGMMDSADENAEQLASNIASSLNNAFEAMGWVVSLFEPEPWERAGDSIAEGVTEGLGIATNAMRGFASIVPQLMEEGAENGVAKFGAVFQLLGIAASTAAAIGVSVEASTSWTMLSEFFALAAASAAFAVALGAGGGGGGAPPQRGASGIDTGDILTGTRPEAARHGQPRVINLQVGAILDNTDSRRQVRDWLSEMVSLNELPAGVRGG